MSTGLGDYCGYWRWDGTQWVANPACCAQTHAHEQRREHPVDSTNLVKDEWLTPEQVCDWLNVKKDWLYDTATNKRIPHVKIGRQLRFSKNELTLWLEEHRQA